MNQENCFNLARSHKILGGCDQWRERGGLDGQVKKVLAERKGLVDNVGQPLVYHDTARTELLVNNSQWTMKLSDCSHKTGNMFVLGQEKKINAHGSEHSARSTMAILPAWPRSLAFSCDIEGIDSPAEDRRPWPL